jgi:hypothetical protein
MTARALLVAVLLASASLAGCAPAAAPRTVSMRMFGGPGNASVTVDDIFVGTLDVVSSRGVALPPGTHHVSVEAPGHLPWDRVVEAREGAGPLRLDVKLVPIPD